MGLGSGIRKKPIPDPGSRDQKGTGSATLDIFVAIIKKYVQLSNR
jgi:hypothetical protein